MVVGWLVCVGYADHTAVDTGSIAVSMMKLTPVRTGSTADSSQGAVVVMKVVVVATTSTPLSSQSTTCLFDGSTAAVSAGTVTKTVISIVVVDTITLPVGQANTGAAALCSAKASCLASRVGFIPCSSGPAFIFNISILLSLLTYTRT